MKNKHSTFPKHLLRTLPHVSTEVAIQQLTEIRRAKGQFYTPTGRLLPPSDDLHNHPQKVQ